MSKKLPEASGEVEIKMQEYFKNQLHNTLGLWKKKGQMALDEMVEGARTEIRSRLSRQGVSERWPALVNLIEEFLPEVTPSVATLVARRVEPIADWLSLEIKNWQPYKLELLVAPQSHLQQDNAWLSSSLVAMAELSGRWLLEKHCPPGELHIRVRQLELESSATQVSHCTVRCEFESAEFELKLAELLRNRQVELFLPVMIYSPQDVLLSQVNFHFEIQWAPLLK